jgi:four helix bundle protein
MEDLLVEDFKKLKVWQKAHELTLGIYRATKHFPTEEKFGITSQLQRSAASIGANIAEGCGRRSDGEFGRFLNIARGSASETEYHLILAGDLGLLREPEFNGLNDKVQEVQRMLAALYASVSESNTKSKGRGASS